jgi:D-alanyl-D-alanine carboxypeptidase
MNRTAAALGMTRTTFKNANGLTEAGHLSTARDMTVLGRRLFYDHPSFYNLFSRRTSDAGGRTVANTNTRFLDAYPGADGIKTGYTVAAGFNLVASAQRGNERIIATVFGGTSTAARNAKISDLLDLGFRKAPSKVREQKPAAPVYTDVETAAPELVAEGTLVEGDGTGLGGGKILRVSGAPARSKRPLTRPAPGVPVLVAAEAPADDMMVAMKNDIEGALALVLEEETAAAETAPLVATEVAEVSVAAPPPRPSDGTMSEVVAEAVSLKEADVVSEAVAEASEVSEGLAAPLDGVALAMDAEPGVAGPAPQAEQVELAMVAPEIQPEVFPDAPGEPTVVTRLSTSGGRNWGINVGTFASQYEAERVLLKTALMEIGTLDEALRKVAKGRTGFDANFLGMTEDLADLACARLVARNVECRTLGPNG